MKCSRVVRAGSSTSLQSSCEALEAEAREWLFETLLCLCLTLSGRKLSGPAWLKECEG